MKKQNRQQTRQHYGQLSGQHSGQFGGGSTASASGSSFGQNQTGGNFAKKVWDRIEHFDGKAVLSSLKDGTGGNRKKLIGGAMAVLAGVLAVGFVANQLRSRTKAMGDSSAKKAA